MIEQTIFYTLASVTVSGALLALTRKNPVHAILYLVTSLFSMAVIFYLLMAPLIAAFEVILYAGAIMVLFLFVIMMLDLGHPEKAVTPKRREMLPALCLTGIGVAALAAVIMLRHAQTDRIPPAVSIREVALRLFQEHSLAVELVSLQLFFALVGALYLGRAPLPQQPAEGDPIQGERN